MADHIHATPWARTCPHGRTVDTGDGWQCPDCGLEVVTERDSTPPRDDTRDGSKSVYFGRQLQSRL